MACLLPHIPGSTRGNSRKAVRPPQEWEGAGLHDGPRNRTRCFLGTKSDRPRNEQPCKAKIDRVLSESRSTLSLHPNALPFGFAPTGSFLSGSHKRERSGRPQGAEFSSTWEEISSRPHSAPPAARDRERGGWRRCPHDDERLAFDYREQGDEAAWDGAEKGGGSGGRGNFFRRDKSNGMTSNGPRRQVRVLVTGVLIPLAPATVVSELVREDTSSRFLSFVDARERKREMTVLYEVINGVFAFTNTTECQRFSNSVLSGTQPSKRHISPGGRIRSPPCIKGTGR